MNRASLLHHSWRRGIDLFAGARGWEARAHRTLGVDLLGIEHWEPAVKTSKAAGLRTLHADVAELDPSDFADEVGDDGMVAGSPPCQSRSVGGKQLGFLDVRHVARCMQDLAEGRDTRPEHRAACADERSILTVEPLRWALALRPRVVLLEQVPPVLPDWKLVGSILERFGYSWWAGLLEAECYGVPQTRDRAVLIARRDGVVAHPPTPTHHRYVPNEPRPQETIDLFGRQLKTWVTMAEAIGWGMTERPSYTFAPGTDNGGADYGGGSGARRAAMRERDEGRWVFERPATTVNGDPRISKPGHHDENESGSQQRGAIRVTVEEAAALQSFPEGWPFVGNQGERFKQIGNAVPPLLGEAILRTVLGEAELEAAA